MTDLPYDVEIRCSGPEDCVDDICRWSDVGLCGIPRRDYDQDADEAEAYDDSWWA